MLQGFDSYFGYCCGKNQYFKFDNYARTTMVRMRNYGLSSDKASYVEEETPSTAEALFQHFNC